MFAFTRGQGRVKTTQDLFTLAEYFAEECNIIYKVIRLFSYDVPSGEDKRTLMALADGVPKHCHQACNCGPNFSNLAKGSLNVLKSNSMK